MTGTGCYRHFNPEVFIYTDLEEIQRPLLEVFRGQRGEGYTDGFLGDEQHWMFPVNTVCNTATSNGYNSKWARTILNNHYHISQNIKLSFTTQNGHLQY